MSAKVVVLPTPHVKLRAVRPSPCHQTMRVDNNNQQAVQAAQLLMLALGIRHLRAQLAVCENKLAECSKRGQTEYKEALEKATECDHCQKLYKERGAPAAVTKNCRACRKKRRAEASMWHAVDKVIEDREKLFGDIRKQNKDGKETVDNKTCKNGVCTLNPPNTN